MIRAPRLPIFLAFSVALIAGAIPGHHARAQERPRYGGSSSSSFPPSRRRMTGTARERSAPFMPLAPLYNTLLRIDPADRTGTRPSSDLAESWTISPDGPHLSPSAPPGVRFPDAACSPPAT